MAETESKNNPPAQKKRVSAKDIKRKKVVRAIVEKRGKTSVSAAMRDAGYSDAYARNPQQFLNTKPTTDLLEQFFPDEMLYGKTRELIDAVKLDSYVFPIAKSGKKKQPLTNEEIRFIVENMAGCTLIYIRDSDFPPGRIAFFKHVDPKARKDGLEIAAKFKGSFKADATNPEDRNPFAKMTDEELAAAIKEAKDVLRKK